MSEQKDSQEIQDAKSAKKFLWMLMLVPIGLGAGVVLSNINFRKVEKAKADVTQFRASQLFDKVSIEDDMAKIFSSGDKKPPFFLRHISSTLGINNYLTVIPSESDENLGFYDIKGKNKNAVTAVVVELSESNPVAKSSLLAVPIAVIKSLAGDKTFSHTLRFVFLSKPYDGDTVNFRKKNEELKDVFIIRAGGEFTLNDELDWKMNEGIWRHPAIAYPHESVDDRITPGQVGRSLQAAKQLNALLKKKMQ